MVSYKLLTFKRELKNMCEFMKKERYFRVVDKYSDSNIASIVDARKTNYEIELFYVFVAFCMQFCYEFINPYRQISI